jgi:hypothetical protein
MAFEVTREVRLIAEADARGDPGDGLALEQSQPRRLDAPSQDVRVWRDPERAGETANEMRRARFEALAGRRQRHGLKRVGLEKVAQPFGELAHAAGILLVDSILEVRPQAFGHEHKVGLRLQRGVGMTKAFMQSVKATAQWSILDAWLVDRTTDQALTQNARLEVENSLPVATTGCRAAVVNDLRRKHADSRATCAPMLTIEVIADLAVVDDEDRPGVVRVRRVGMLVKLGVQHLADAGYRRPPGPNLLRRNRT